MAFVYIIQNSVDGKGYVGITDRTVHSRFGQHINYSSKRSHLCHAMKLHGKKNFSVTEVASGLHLQQAFEMEKLWICVLQTNRKEFGYNKTAGGEYPPSHKGKKQSEEWIRKRADAKRGKRLNAEARRNISEGHKGQIPWNKGTRGRMVAWNKGIKMGANPKHSAWLRAHPTRTGYQIGHVGWNKGKHGVQDYSSRRVTKAVFDRLPVAD